MKYTINKLAVAAGVTVRTLHHYDQIGLLTPARDEENGYRHYGESELLRLQQILIYRELELPLATIQRILDESGFDYAKALNEHKQSLLGKQKRVGEIIKTIDKTRIKLRKGEAMNANDMYGGLTNKQMEEYQKEAEQKWGDSDAYKQSVANVKKMGKAGLKKIFDESQAIVLELVRLMDHDATSPEVQAVVAKHRANIGHFYTVTDEIYAGLAHMYVDDARFTATYDNVKPGLAKFLSDAMLASRK